ncbi:Guanylate kinase like protein [Aduncisulcus paluster]|uniref:guanylate kinase n=1 Tax=Aduncisulcus paluster TaxID=2918883 RepID=A0ABQ5JXQ5_9EUKA|nr:Guanylate kinase like protein [Aduncisulcus paluster]
MPSDSVRSSPRPIVLNGPSGVGKSTLIGMLMKEFPELFGFSVSHTTRTPRVGEKDGVDYFFVSQEEIEKYIEEGKMLETAKVHTNFYGTSVMAVEMVLESGKHCIIDVDIQGATTMKSNARFMASKPIFIFISPPDFDELRSRLMGRGTETPESMAIRLKDSLAWDKFYRSNPEFYDHRIINDDLETAYKEFRDIILE